MIKQSRKKLRRPKHKSLRKRASKARRAYGKMVGGDFTPEENQELSDLGFSQDDIQVLSNTGVGLNIIQMSLNQVNPATGAPFTPQELIQSVNEANEEMNQLDVSGISNVSDDEHNLDIDENLDNSYNDSMNTTQENISNDGNNNFVNNSLDNGSLHLSDLENSNNDSINTTKEDSFGGRKRKASPAYGKARKTRKTRKGRKSRKSRKQRGGICYGNGVGANNYDPNFSIYNTRELTLFPYRPTN